MKSVGKYLALLLLLLCASFAYSQEVKVSVKLGEEPAVYAHIRVNGVIVGVADSSGVYAIPVDSLKAGDKIDAGYSTFLSDNVVWNGKDHDIQLDIKDNLLGSISVKGDNVRRLKEYLALFKKYNYRYETDLYKFKVSYDLYYVNTYLEDSLSMSDSMIFAYKRYHGPLMRVIGFFNKNYFKIEYPQDTTGIMKGLSINAFNIAYASAIMSRLTNRRYLSESVKKRELLIHKAVSEDGIVSYIFFEGKNRENQTVISLDKSGKKIERITRLFIGDGKGWVADNALAHSVIIFPEYKGSRIELKEVFTEVSDPSFYTFFQVHSYDISHKKASVKELNYLNNVMLNNCIFLNEKPSKKKN